MKDSYEIKNYMGVQEESMGVEEEFVEPRLGEIGLIK